MQPKMLLFFTVVALVSSTALQLPGSIPQLPVTAYAPQQLGGINACTSKKLDGAEVTRENIAKCQRETAEAREAMLKRANASAMKTFKEEISKGTSPKDGGQCIEKAVQGSDKCILAGIIDNAVRKRRYSIRDVGNATILEKGSKPIGLIVSTDYSIQEITKPRPKKKKIIALPPVKREIQFNQIGQVVGAKGNFAQESKDACKPCDPSKRTVETASEKCSFGCQLKGTSALISKTVQKKEGGVTPGGKSGGQDFENSEDADRNREPEEQVSRAALV